MVVTENQPACTALNAARSSSSSPSSSESQHKGTSLSADTEHTQAFQELFEFRPNTAPGPSGPTHLAWPGKHARSLWDPDGGRPRPAAVLYQRSHARRRSNQSLKTSRAHRHHHHARFIEIIIKGR